MEVERLRCMGHSGEVQYNHQLRESAKIIQFSAHKNEHLHRTPTAEAKYAEECRLETSSKLKVLKYLTKMCVRMRERNQE